MNDSGETGHTQRKDIEKILDLYFIFCLEFIPKILMEVPKLKIYGKYIKIYAKLMTLYKVSLVK